jgi:uncharacterized surface protein with fasciclin (FAS1) repeats
MSERQKLFAAFAFATIGMLSSTALLPAAAMEKTVNVGGAAMYPSKNIIQNAVNSKDHTTLVAAVKAAGLVDTLQGRWSVHGVCAHQYGVRQAAGGHCREPGEA